MLCRLDYAGDGLAKLNEYEAAAGRQSDVIDGVEKKLADEDLSKVKTDSDDIKKQIEDHEVLFF